MTSEVHLNKNKKKCGTKYGINVYITKKRPLAKIVGQADKISLNAVTGANNYKYNSYRKDFHSINKIIETNSFINIMHNA